MDRFYFYFCKYQKKIPVREYSKPPKPPKRGGRTPKSSNSSFLLQRRGDEGDGEKGGEKLFTPCPRQRGKL